MTSIILFGCGLGRREKDCSLQTYYALRHNFGFSYKDVSEWVQVYDGQKTTHYGVNTFLHNTVLEHKNKG